MAVWSGLGVNWGNEFTANGGYSGVPSYSSSELDYLKSVGITKLRISRANYDSSGLTEWRSAITLAKSKGFFVIARNTIGATFSLSTFQGAYTTAVLAEIDFLNSLGVEIYEVGNEMEGRVDGTTITTTTIRSEVKNLATLVKNARYTGRTSYSVSDGTPLTNWNSDGVGSMGGLDYVSFNLYSGWTHRDLFQTALNNLVSIWGNKTYLSEWGLSGAWTDVPADEERQTVELNYRMAIVVASGIQEAYFFTWRFLPDNFPIMLTNNSKRLMFQSLLRGRRSEIL